MPDTSNRTANMSAAASSDVTATYRAAPAMPPAATAMTTTSAAVSTTATGICIKRPGKECARHRHHDKHSPCHRSFKLFEH
jgi:hypothetical protein